MFIPILDFNLTQISELRELFKTQVLEREREREQLLQRGQRKVRETTEDKRYTENTGQGKIEGAAIHRGDYQSHSQQWTRNRGEHLAEHHSIILNWTGQGHIVSSVWSIGTVITP